MEEERITVTEPREDRVERGGLSRRRLCIAHPIVLTETELRGHTTDGTRAFGGEITRGESPCRDGRATRIGELDPAARTERERTQRRQLPRAEARLRRSVEGRPPGDREREDGLPALAACGGQRVARAPGEGRREHGAHRVRDSAAVLTRDPFRERELVRTEQRKRM